MGCWRGYLFGARCRFSYGLDDATATHCLLLQEIQIGPGFTFLVLAHSGSPRQNPESRKMVVVVSQHQKGKTNLDLLEQEIVSYSGISWAICKSERRPRHITTLASHRSVFLQTGCPSCHPTNSVQALKAGYHNRKKQNTFLHHLAEPLRRFSPFL